MIWSLLINWVGPSECFVLQYYVLVSVHLIVFQLMLDVFYIQSYKYMI